MAELHAPEGPINAATTTTNADATPTTIPPPILPPSAETTTATTTNPTNNNNFGPSLAPKRQRRPSVRLGEIGNQPSTKPWRFHKDPSLAAKSSKTRPLTNLVNGGANYHEAPEIEDDLGFVIPKQKPKRTTTKRARTNWTVATKVDNGDGEDSRKDINEEEFRDFEPEGSESPLREQSIENENGAFDFWNRRTVRARVSESRDNGMPEKCGTGTGTSRDANFGSGSERDWIGVRNWLIGLGLGRYAPVFEIHEVDDEVLPMLTLEDLRDMGINAVGSRRKLYTAIQNLQKGFSRD